MRQRMWKQDPGAFWVTNTLLYRQDDDDLADRKRRVSRFPEKFGWIHQFDALETARNSLRMGHAGTGEHA